MTIGSERTPYRCYAKLFCRWDEMSRLLRLGRIVWAWGRPGTGKGWTAKLSFGLTPRLLQINSCNRTQRRIGPFSFDRNDQSIIILGLLDDRIVFLVF
jgi:hypothetical protein